MTKPHDDSLPHSAELEISIEQSGSIDRSDLTISQFLEKQGLKAGVELDDSESSAADSLKDRQGRKYDLGDIIAQGGNGAVLDAKDHCIRRHVAMKVMRETQQSASGVIRFIEEAQVTGQLEHPSIVPVHELGVDASGSVFYTMKYVKGRNLSDVLKDIRAGDAATIRDFPLVRLLNIFLKVCDAMAFAHSKGVIHRDLKPGNIMLGDYGEVLVVDWGLAKVLGRDGPDLPEELETSDGWAVESDRIGDFGDGFQTMVGDVMGTPSYMPPEQAEGQLDQIGVQSDVYSLGAVLYHILTLRPPVSGEDKRTVLAKVSAGEITHPSHYNGKTTAKVKGAKREEIIELKHCQDRKVPGSLAAVAMKSLSKKPVDRYESVLQLQQEVQAYLEGFATLAEHAGLIRQCILLFNRNKKEATILTAAAALLVGLTVGFIHQVNQKKQEAVQAAAVAESARGEAEQARVVAETARGQAEIARGEADDATRRVEVQAEKTRINLYHAQMINAGRSLQAGGIRLVTKALENWIPENGQADLRGWEWHYLHAESALEEISVDNNGGFASVNWSGDGKRILAVEVNGVISVISTDTGKVEKQTEWVELGKGGIYKADWSSNRVHVAINRRVGRGYYFWNYDAEIFHEPAATPYKNIVAVKWDPSGKNLLVYDASRSGLIWNAETQESRFFDKPAASMGIVMTAAWSPDGREFAMGDQFGSVTIRDAITFEVITQTPPDHKYDLRSLAWSPDGQQLAAGAMDGKLIIWNKDATKVLLRLQAHKNYIRSLAWHPDGKTLLTGSDDNRIKIWDVCSGDLVLDLHAHEDSVMEVNWRPDGRHFATASMDGTVKSWDLESLRARRPFKSVDGPMNVRWSCDGRFIAEGGYGAAGGLQIRDIEHLDNTSVIYGPTYLTGFTIKDDGSRIAVYQDFKVKVHEIPSGKSAVTSKRMLKGLVLLEWQPGGNLLAWSGGILENRGQVVILNGITGEESGNFSPHDGYRIKSLDWSPDGTRIVSCSGEIHIGIWDPITGKVMVKAEYDDRYHSVVWSPDGNFIGVATTKGELLLLNPQTLDLIRKLPGHNGKIHAIAFSPDGRRLVSVGEDETIRLWNPDNGLECLTLQSEVGIPHSVCWSPDGTRILVGGDGKVQILDAR